MKALSIERLQLMTNGRLNRGVFAPKGASQTLGLQIIKVLFIRKLNAARSCLSALEHTPSFNNPMARSSK
jgi:hypothetical protein